MFSQVIVPLDCSSFSELALPLAKEVAARCSGTLRLLHVHVPQYRIPTCEDVLGQRAEAAIRRLEALACRAELEYLHGVRRTLIGDFGPEKPPRVVPAVVGGPVTPALLRLSKRDPDALVVMATHGRDALGRAWLGSVADVVVRHGRLPVLLVRHGGGPPAGAAGLRRVLVPLDGTARAEQILPHAVRLACGFGAEMTLLRVVRGGNGAEARDYLAGVAGGVPCGAEVRVVKHADPAAAILAASDELGADLIALATRGRPAAAGLIERQVTGTLTRRSSIPLLVLRSRAAASAGPAAA